MSNSTASYNIRSGIDTFGKTIGNKINAVGNTAAYKVYTGTLTSGSPTFTVNLQTALGRKQTGGYLLCLTTNVQFTASFSVDGTVYGDEIPVLDKWSINLDNWVEMVSMRLTRVSSDSQYLVVVI